jgi:hypothetical protein
VGGLAETLSPTQADPEQWRDRLLASYAAQGFVVRDVVPKPPLRPELRVVEGGSHYDYHSVPLPMPDADEALTEGYNRMMAELQATYGRDNVVTAFPTDEMLQADPTLGLDTHSVIMVRQL